MAAGVVALGACVLPSPALAASDPPVKGEFAIPDSGTADLPVNSITPCTVGKGKPGAAVYLALIEDVGDGVLRDDAVLTPDKSGKWSGVLTLPDNLVVGTSYMVYADCWADTADEAPAFIYNPATISIVDTEDPGPDPTKTPPATTTATSTSTKPTTDTPTTDKPEPTKDPVTVSTTTITETSTVPTTITSEAPVETTVAVPTTSTQTATTTVTSGTETSTSTTAVTTTSEVPVVTTTKVPVTTTGEATVTTTRTAVVTVTYRDGREGHTDRKVTHDHDAPAARPTGDGHHHEAAAPSKTAGGATTSASTSTPAPVAPVATPVTKNPTFTG